MKWSVIFFRLTRVVAALIMLQTLYFKFTASEESVYIFATVGMEPWGRIAVGSLELIASILLIVPAFVWLGSVLAFGLMAGAIGLHLTVLGIEVKGDGGLLFFYACLVAVCSVVSMWFSRNQIPEPILRYLPSFLKQRD